MPPSRLLVPELLPPLLHFVLTLLMYQLWVIQLLPRHQLLVNAEFDNKKSTFCTLCSLLLRGIIDRASTFKAERKDI